MTKKMQDWQYVIIRWRHLMRINNNYKAVINSNSEKLPVLFKSILVGLSVGIVITAYRLTLMEAEELSFRLYHYLRNNLMLIPIAFIVLGAVGFLIGTLYLNTE
jgi:hypothetical protein